ncbi:MAG: two-component system activity regulator YycH [Lactobacillus sp.]|nr:two-component system activity regulator YycH [Lactobacillus sp.]
MKHKFDVKDAIFTAATIFVIVLSLVLWFFNLTSDRRFSNVEPTSTKMAAKDQTKSLYDFYAPTTIFGFKNNHYYQFYDTKHNLALEFTKKFKQVSLTQPSVESQSQKSYEKKLNDSNYLQLVYPDQVTFKIFSDAISLSKGHREFNRIFISSSDKEIYFGNDRNYTLYKMAVKADFSKLLSYAENANQKRECQLVRLKGGYSAYYQNSIKQNVYNYLTNHASDNTLVSRLLGTSGVVSSAQGDGATLYTQNYSDRLLTQVAGQNTYRYTHFSKIDLPNTTKVLEDSMSYVYMIGINEQDLRFFDADNSKVLFTNYIEGYPVFIDGEHPQVTTEYQTDNFQMLFSSLNFEIPIPFDGQTKTLPATTTVINRLRKNGLKTENIQRIELGFVVKRDKKNSELISLEPTYIIKAQGTWRSYSAWLSFLTDKKQNTQVPEPK